MTKKLWNWRLWVGFAVAILALVIMVAFFIRMRSVLWFSVALLIGSGLLLASGLRRAYGQRETYRGQIAGPILTVFSILILALFAFVTYEIPRSFAAARNAPRVGQPAPQFTLVDTGKKSVSLAGLLSLPITPADRTARSPKAVLLVFYRGYW